VEEAGVTALLIAAQPTRQPEITANVKSLWKQVKKSALSRNRRAGPNPGPSGTKAARKDARTAVTTIGPTTVVKIGQIVTKAALSRASSNALNRFCFPENRFPNISRRVRILQQQHPRLP
jgi:hypothetical protein